MGSYDVSVTSLPTYDYISDMATNPQVLITLTVLILILYLAFAVLGSLGGQDTEDKKGGMVFLEVFIWAVFLFLLFVNGAVYFFGFDITTSLKSLSDKPEIDINVNRPSPSNNPQPAQPSGSDSQVFHIPGNDYVYEDAKSICKAYGARLATYDEVESSYNDGAEWCSYGWSDKQLALFPTQKKTYDTLQKIEGHENDCGRPGINGGYIDNPAVKFGVNCFGNKPKITALERDIMNNQSKYPKTRKDLAKEHRTKYWSERLQDIILSPFNYESWDKI